MSDPAQTRSNPERTPSVYWLALPLSAASVLDGGYGVYVANQAIQLPLVHWLNDPSLYPGDPFVDTLRSYGSLFWYLVAAAERFMPLESLLLALFLAERLAVIVAAGRLAASLAPALKLAPVAAMTLFAFGVEPIVGSGAIVMNYVEQTGFSMPFLLLAMTFLLERRPFAWALCLAIAINLNALYAGFLLTYCAGVWVIEPEYRNRPRPWLLGLLLALALSVPILWTLASGYARGETSADLWLAASRLRLAMHLYPLTWSKERLAFFAFVVIVSFSFFSLPERRFKGLSVRCRVWTVIAVAWLAFAYFAACLVRSPGLLLLQPARGTDIWVALISVALVSESARELETARASEAKMFWIVALGALMVAWRPTRDHLFLFEVLGLGSLVLWSLRESLLTVCVPTVGPVTALAATVVLCLAGIRLGLPQIERPDADKRALTAWAATATPKDSLFLVDPTAWKEFRAMARRPVFITWKDGSAISWNRAFAGTWAERLAALEFDIREPGLTEETAPRELETRYTTMGDDAANGLGLRYRIGYWVVSRSHRSSLPVVFENRAFKVLSLTGSAGGRPLDLGHFP